MELNSQPASAPRDRANLTLVGDINADPSDIDEGDSRLTAQIPNQVSSQAHDQENGALEGEKDLFVGIPADERPRVLADFIRRHLDDDKAEDIVEIPLTGKSDIADMMVIASGRSQRHVGAIADKLLRRLKEVGLRSVRCEGQPACDWVLIDAHDVIVHLFRPEVRSFYNLERIWSETAQGVKNDSATVGEA